MEKLTEIELNIAKEIIRNGLVKAAESLSFFMKEKINFNGPNFAMNEIENNFKITEKTGDNLHLLSTDVVGELKGVCCLIFSEEEADKLRKTALPEEILNTPALMEEMADAIMLEVDNIISASVITQFSNILGHKIHGGVPKLKKVNSEELIQFVNNDLKKDLYIINFNTQFTSDNINFSPDFVWLFDDTFLRSINSFSQNSSKVEKLKMV